MLPYTPCSHLNPSLISHSAYLCQQLHHLSVPLHPRIVRSRVPVLRKR